MVKKFIENGVELTLTWKVIDKEKFEACVEKQIEDDLEGGELTSGHQTLERAIEYNSGDWLDDLMDPYLVSEYMIHTASGNRIVEMYKSGELEEDEQLVQLDRFRPYHKELRKIHMSDWDEESKRMEGGWYPSHNIIYLIDNYPNFINTFYSLCKKNIGRAYQFLSMTYDLKDQYNQVIESEVIEEDE